MRTRVKICGITRLEDAAAAVEAGADAIGLVFYPPSPRAVTLEQARAIAQSVPPFVTVVGLFVDAAYDDIQRVLQTVPLGLLQFHGDETPQDCEQYHRPYIKAIRMREGVDLSEVMAAYQGAQGILLDSYQPGTPGGTGLTFDWSVIPQDIAKSIVLAGGLTPENILDATTRIQPYAVDVSGGVELQKGIKSADKISAFMNQIKQQNK